MEDWSEIQDGKLKSVNCITNYLTQLPMI